MREIAFKLETIFYPHENKIQPDKKLIKKYFKKIHLKIKKLEEELKHLKSIQSDFKNKDIEKIKKKILNLDIKYTFSFFYLLSFISLRYNDYPHIHKVKKCDDYYVGYFKGPLGKIISDYEERGIITFTYHNDQEQKPFINLNQDIYEISLLIKKHYFINSENNKLIFKDFDPVV